MLKEIPTEVRKAVLGEMAAGLANARTDAIGYLISCEISDANYEKLCAYYKGVINSLDEQINVLDEIINRSE